LAASSAALSRSRVRRLRVPVGMCVCV